MGQSRNNISLFATLPLVTATLVLGLEKGYEDIKEAGDPTRYFVIVDEAADMTPYQECKDIIVDNGSTHLKTIEASYIREALVDEMLDFYDLLRNYIKSTTQQRKDRYFLEIIEKLDSSSAFAAFKRQVIKNNSNLTNIFGEHINVSRELSPN